MIYTVNIRALKDKLSAYLRSVREGNIILVSDRGTVIAELRQPQLHQAARDAVQVKRDLWIEEGLLRPGLPNDANAYIRSGIRLTKQSVDDALAWTRSE